MEWAISINPVGRSRNNFYFWIYKLELKEGFFAFSASKEPKMDRLRPAMLIAALVVDVGCRPSATAEVCVHHASLCLPD